MKQNKKGHGQKMHIKNRILSMEATPMFEQEIQHGEFTMREPNWEGPINVVFTYYDGRKAYCVVHDSHELEVLNIYHKRNQEMWADDTEYD